MSKNDNLAGLGLRFLGEIGDEEEAKKLTSLFSMTPEERSQFYLEQALEDLKDAVEVYPDDALIPVLIDDIPKDQVLLKIEDVSRWVERLQEIPEFVLNDHIVKLLIDIISTTDAAGQKLDVIAPEFPAPTLVSQH